MSTHSLDKLRQYNNDIFNKFHSQHDHFQLGFFSGNTIAFIGQNPGRTYNRETEERTRRVSAITSYDRFEGEYERLIRESRIGKYLDAVIRQKWDRVSFTNISKVSTENNEEPSEEEINKYLPITKEQIRLLKPEIIVCLGRFAGRTLTGGVGGFVHVETEFEGIPLITFYHPSYVARTGQTKEYQEKMRNTINQIIIKHRKHANN